MSALAVYLGTEGLKGYLKIQSKEVQAGDLEAFNIQKCLMVSYEDRGFLTKADIEIIRKLGLKFRGHNSWPLFRNYTPGYYPWYLTRDEVRYLTLALEQAVEVSLRFKEDQDLLIPPQRNHYLVRVPTKDAQGLRWRDEWLEPKPLEKEEVLIEPTIDEIRLKRIEKRTSRQLQAWEVDFFYSPEPVKNKKGERPYYPYFILWIDQESRFLLDILIAQGSKLSAQFIEQSMKLFERVKNLPTEILMRKKEIFQLLKPIASRLGINLRLVKRLVAMEEAKTSMGEFFGKLDH